MKLLAKPVPLGILIVIFFLTSCELFTYKRIFPDSYYEDNFIAAIGFDKLTSHGAPLPSGSEPPIGVWDFAYRYQNWDGIDYLSLETTGQLASDYSPPAGPPAGLNPSAPVYRLELKNLIQNGDFESGLGTWAAVTAEGDPSTASLITSGAINGDSISLDIKPYSLIRYSIVPSTTGTPSESMLVEVTNYEVNFRWQASSAPSGENNQVRINDNSSPFSFNTNTLYARSTFVAKVTNELVFEVPNIGWTSVIDDVSIKKVGGLELRLLLRQSDTSPELKDLLYRFSVWVRSDPDVDVHKAPYHLDVLDVDMRATEGLSSVSTSPRSAYKNTAAPGGISSNAWKKVETEVRSGNLMFPDGSDRYVLTLVIKLDAALPGTILIAQPELRAFPDGYPD